MAVSCSICSKGEESAGVVNEMLFKKSTLDEIAAATGFHRSSVDRHKKGNCTHSFPSYRAARVAAKNKSLTVENSRVVVGWPANAPGSDGREKFTLMGTTIEIPRAELRPSDVLLRVQYQTDDIFRLPNPDALDTPSVRAEAEAEHVLRGFSKTSDLDSPD